MADFGFEETLRMLGAWTRSGDGPNDGPPRGHGAGDSPPRGEDASFATLFSPIYPYNRFSLLNPFISIVGAASVFLLTGVAAASLVVLSFALVVVVFLLSEVFGYEIAMPPGMAPRFH
jgi:hypothetical protein